MSPKRRHTKTATCTVLDTSQHAVSDKLECRCLDMSPFWICRRFGCIQNGDTPKWQHIQNGDTSKRRHAPFWMCHRFGCVTVLVCHRFGFVTVLTCIRPNNVEAQNATDSVMRGVDSVLRGADSVVVNISTCHASGPCSISGHSRHGV